MRSRSMKRGALLAAKVTVSLALLSYLFATSDLRALEERVRTAESRSRVDGARSGMCSGS